MKLRLGGAAAVFMLLRVATLPALPLCGFHGLTGRPCPLCGLTRALCALANGRTAESLHFHALAPLGFAMLFALFWDHPLRGRLWLAGTAAFAVYGVWRAVASNAM